MAGVYNIPSGYSFLESLAKGLFRMGEENPFHLCRTEVYLPTRRACIEIKRAFMRQGRGQCMLLPKLSLLGDLDEDEEYLNSPEDELDLKPLIPPFKRVGLLASLIQEYTKKSGVLSSPLISLKLAKSLSKLMDQASIENVPWEGLIHLVPSEFANHWQLTLNFLEIITTHWPKIIEEKGFVEPYTRHRQMVDSLLSRWQATPPQHPIIAAGSTGTMPATARLLQAIAKLPQGMVILPGLDTRLSTEETETLSSCHPQYAPTRFLQKMGLLPAEISCWPGLEEQNEGDIPRARLFAETLKTSFSLKGPSPAQALEGVFLIPCASPQEEALAIAVLLRQQLEIPHQKIALITSDLKLAERVTWELKRWGIQIDSSSGEPLDLTPPGVFLNLCAEFAANPSDQVALLSLLKHPLFRMGKQAGMLRSDIRQFEKMVLRKDSNQMPPWLQEFNTLTHAFIDIKEASFEELLNTHCKLAEQLSTDAEGVCQLWKGAKGEAVRDFTANLKDASGDFPPLSLKDYPPLLKEMSHGQTIRFRPQKHPRLAILGPIEARLFHADVMILGGLNEGNWPPEIDVDPWLNRPMRKEMGFPSPERRIGLSSHDFGQAFASPKVYLTRALKVDGTPTLACRWLERLEVYLKAWKLELKQESRILEWVRQFDQPEVQEIQLPPLPMPSVKSRPRRLSVTQIETWMRDPYALYARHILGLLPLDPLNNQVDASDRGTLIHNALDQFFKICPDPHHKHALDILLTIGKTLFEPFEKDPSVKLFWWPRFCHLARWFIENEKSTRLNGTQTFTEVRGKLTLETPLGPFECTAKADRIDLLPDGRLRILDYKTGSPPTDQDVQLGFSPQLPLEGAIALQQGFEGIPAASIESLQFWWLKGDAKGGVIKTLSGDPFDLSMKALAGLERMILLFEEEKTPYPARPIPGKGLKYNDYAHLARLQEWGRL
ncbi:MAG TPA: PD-(D/E)XK nuclease family protein [Alphaproteobacteria bacterium]|nr:PD-(D/E)XK nuclease family protein [Alphaproteobacteria bacterium]